MFRRDPQAGSLYWLGHRDATGAYLDGGRAYKLTVPLPVPGKLFWSVTVYDARTRSQIQTPQAKALLSSLFDFPDATGDDSVDLSSGPTAPASHQDQWIQTTPRSRLVRLLSHLRPRASGLRQDLETRRLRTPGLTASEARMAR